MQKEKAKMPKLDGYDEGDGFILMARRKGNTWVVSEGEIISTDYLKDKGNKLMKAHLIEIFEAFQKVYEAKE